MTRFTAEFVLSDGRVYCIGFCGERGTVFRREGGWWSIVGFGHVDADVGSWGLPGHLTEHDLDVISGLEAPVGRARGGQTPRP